MKLGQQLARQLLLALDAKGWTQADLARETGLSTKHVNQMVQGKSGALAMWDYAAFALDCEWNLSLDDATPNGSKPEVTP